MTDSAAAERVQKLLSRLGLASRREAEEWIRAGRLTVNGRPAVLGMRVSGHDQLKLDGRLIRQRAPKNTPVFLCHRSPGEPLLPARRKPGGEAPPATSKDTFGGSLSERLPHKAGRRFISVSPLPTVDGGLELLTADGALATRLQRAVHGLESEFSLRVRGELTAEQQQAVQQGQLDRGNVEVRLLESSGGEGANRWYRLVAIGASGNEVRQLFVRQAVTLGRMLRTRLGTLELPRLLPRGHWRELTDEELESLLSPPPVAEDETDDDE